MERRVSTCSSIGESALEAELTDIKMQIALLEENLKKRPRHRAHHGVKGSDEVRGQDGEVRGSMPEVDRRCEKVTESAGWWRGPGV